MVKECVLVGLRYTIIKSVNKRQNHELLIKNTFLKIKTQFKNLKAFQNIQKMKFTIKTHIKACTYSYKLKSGLKNFINRMKIGLTNPVQKWLILCRFGTCTLSHPLIKRRLNLNLNILESYY
jgi:hypothetical protein